MKVTVDQHSGFCWGVVRTVEIAEQELENGGKLYSLGPVIHNPVETERLREKGLEVVGHADLEKLGGGAGQEGLAGTTHPARPKNGASAPLLLNPAVPILTFCRMQLKWRLALPNANIPVFG